MVVHYLRNNAIACGNSRADSATLRLDAVTCARCKRYGRYGKTPERVFLAQVLALARKLGYRVYHTHDSRKSQPGFPDLVLLRPPRLIFSELKTDTGTLTIEQAAWLRELRQAGCEAHCWRPTDLAHIALLLQRKG